MLLVDIVGQYVGWVEFVVGYVIGIVGSNVQVDVVGDVFVIGQLVMQ